MSEPRRLSDHLEPALSPARLARNRAAIEARLTPDRGRWFALLAGTLVAAAAVALMTWPTSEEAPPAVGATVWPVSEGARVAAAGEATAVTLDDGSVVALEPHTSVRGAVRGEHDIALEIEHGEAHFDVARDPSRTFRVLSGDVEVRVIGTAFTVTREAGRVRVAVDRGRVEVRRGEELAVLGPGEQWGGDEWLAAETAEVTPPEPVPAEPAPEVRPRGRDERRSDGEARAARAEEARALFAAAQEARRGGRPDHAAALFSELVAQHPDDPRAGLAAFELGRIRLDVMHDTRGSIEALERALSLSPRGGFREDALARLVVLYDRTGAQARCREARSRYLADHPDGVHAAEVGALCD